MPRAILLPALLSSAVHAASLSPCGSRAIFEITEDGGTNFAAVVRVPRWQEGAKVQLVWGANAVSVRDESVSKSVKLTEQSSAAQTFKLDKLHVSVKLLGYDVRDGSRLRLGRPRATRWSSF